jgi:hypothetical protein
MTDRHMRAATLLDIFEIQQVLNNYAIALDTREFDLLDEVFAPHAKTSIAGAPMAERSAESQARIRVSMQAFDATQHFMGPASIEVRGDTAVSRCYFIATHTKNSLRPNPHLRIGGWYDDELAQIDGHWRIMQRIGTPAWYEGNPAVLGLQMPPGAYEWSANRDCPAWLKPMKK